MSLARAIGLLGGLYLVDRWRREHRSPDDYQPTPSTGTASANWPHIAYGQLDVLGRHQGFWAGRDPRLPGGGSPAPLMTVDDALGIYRYWKAKVEPFAADDQYYQTNTLAAGGLDLLAALGLGGAAAGLADEARRQGREVNTT